MKPGSAKKHVRCAIYTRVSTDQGLEQDFNSLHAQYDASQAYIRSQAHAGWTLLRSQYDDGGFSGANTDRPALQRLLADVRARKVDVIVVYKVDRLTRSLADFAKLVELFDAHNVSFVSVTRLETVLSVPWQKVASTRRREILIPEGTSPQQVRRIRSENRATLVASIARSRRWLNELITDPTASAESIAKREQCSVRKVNRTLSLAFLAPDLVKAAIDGRLPHGMGVTRLADLPAEWSRQRRILGLASH